MTSIVDPHSKKTFYKILTDVRYKILLRVKKLFVHAKIKCVDKFLFCKKVLSINFFLTHHATENNAPLVLSVCQSR